MTNIHKILAIFALCSVLFLSCTAVAATPRLAGEYQNPVEASALGHYYDLKINNHYEKGELKMVDGKTVHGNVTEIGTWEEEVGGIKLTYTNDDGRKVSYNTLNIARHPYVSQLWMFTVLEKDQTESIYLQTSYYE